MNKIVFFLLIPFSMLSQSSGEVSYTANWKENDTLSQPQVSWEDAIRFFADTVNFRLVYNEKEAFFELLENENYALFNDYFEKENPTIPNSTYVVKQFFDYHGSTLQKQDSTYRLKEKYLFVDDRIVKQENEDSWIILEEKQKILGYVCRKATKKIYFFDNAKSKGLRLNVYAWFTEELPRAYGPNYISGLPGLVLKYEDVFFDYEATEINFKNTSVPKLPDEIPILSSEEYEDYWEQAKNDF
ncbi:MAG: GLPGLI family protein [Bacteroidota bacterium]